jgi:hypothetical protein
MEVSPELHLITNSGASGISKSWIFRPEVTNRNEQRSGLFSRELDDPI